MALGKLTAIGINNYLDGKLFEGLHIPEGIDLDTFEKTFFLSYGECPVLYMNPDYVKMHISLWAEKTYANWNRMIKALLKEYDPLRNYDKYEDETTENDVQNSGSDTVHVNYHRDTTDTRTDNLTQENKVSAFNESTYSPDSKTENGGSRTDTIDDTNIGDTTSGFGRKVDEDTERHSHIYGNIGVTTSQQMLREELEIAKFNIYDVMATSLASEICVLIY